MTTTQHPDPIIDIAVPATLPPDTALTAVPGGVTAPAGFRAAGIHCGIRGRRPDLALIVSDDDAVAAGVFTPHKLAAAPVVLCRELLQASGGRARAVVINSGNANAITGEGGITDARAMGRRTADVIGAPTDQVLVCSTGVIGQRLPIDRIDAAIPALVDAADPHGSRAAADAIITSDNGPKYTACEVTCPAGTFRVGVIAKGAGMIEPSMATMLAFVTTDAPLSAEGLAGALHGANARTFNCICVDGDMSTNDCVIAMANGRSGLDPAAFEPGTPGHAAVEAALEAVLQPMAKMILADGEGSTKVMEVVVSGAANAGEARRAARAVTRSLLVKCALHGADANWGRIAAAVGSADVELVPEQLSVSIAGLPMLRPGFVSDVDEAEAKRRMSASEILIEVDLGAGSASGRAWGCDLSAEYVRINADYRT